jgi:hypothetical protein
MLLLLSLVMAIGCRNPGKPQQLSDIKNIPEVNLDHLLYLYDDVVLPDGRTAGIVHIYSEYPDYNYEIEDDEGFACVDDVARAMMVDHIRFSEDPAIKVKYERMAEFLLYMQAGNGYFHNFVWNDMTINKTYRTSLSEPNWWSWRAFWALSSFHSENDSLMVRVGHSCEMLAGKLFERYLDIPEVYDTIEGVVVPIWLPLETAGDQAAILILGLEAYYLNRDKNPRALKLIQRLAEGIRITQKGGVQKFPFGAYLSWQNTWHAYGNTQAYAMLRAGQLLEQPAYVESALLEIDNLYPYLKYEKYPSSFSIKLRDGKYEVTGFYHFPKIAYGFRPMIWASVEAYKLTKKEKYLQRALETASWFTGKNYARTPMYNAENGRCYDGITGPLQLNMNAGAESTVEALLSMQVFESLKQDGSQK